MTAINLHAVQSIRKAYAAFPSIKITPPRTFDKSVEECLVDVIATAQGWAMVKRPGVEVPYIKPETELRYAE